MIHAKGKVARKGKKYRKTALAEQAISAAGETRRATDAVGSSSCAACGIPKNEWAGNGGGGVRSGDRICCCAGCADGTGCDCV